MSNLFSLHQFQEILKPNYNSVDLAEVELVDTYDPQPRGNDSQLLAVSLNTKYEVIVQMFGKKDHKKRPKIRHEKKACCFVG